MYAQTKVLDKKKKRKNKFFKFNKHLKYILNDQTFDRMNFISMKSMSGWNENYYFEAKNS